MNQEELEYQFRQNDKNYPGYEHPLEFRPLKNSDTVLLNPILKRHGSQLRDFLADYEFASHWEMRNAASYVRDLVDAPFPTFAYLFLIGKRIVGMAYTGGTGDSILDAQVVLWVHPDHQGRRIGQTIGYTMRNVVLEMWGFNSFNWFVAEDNIASIKTAESLGLTLHSKMTGAEIHARAESGEWRRYVQFRDISKPGGVLQGEQSLTYWAGSRNLSTLDAILQAQKNGEREKVRELAVEELRRMNLTPKQKVDDRNLYQKALDRRLEEMAKIYQQIASKAGRIAYNEQLRKRRKKK